MTVAFRLLAISLVTLSLAAEQVVVAPTPAVAAATTIKDVPDPLPSDGNYPALVRDPLPNGNVVTWAVVDPAGMDVFAGVATGPDCTAPGPKGYRCTQTVADIAKANFAAAGMGANLTDYIAPEGLVVVNHVEMAPANPNTTSFCVGDRHAAARPAVSISKTATAVTCHSAVSGESLIDGSTTPPKAMIEGEADAGDPTKFWWSVKPYQAVERQLVGVLPDGRVLIAVATSGDGHGRGGMSLPQAAQFLIDHGAIAGIALDGGHLASLYESHRGDIIPIPAATGVPHVKVALLFRPTIWTLHLATPPPPQRHRPALVNLTPLPS